MEISLRWQHTEMTTNANLLDLDDGDNSPHPALEILVLTISECFVYKIPPLRSASGHRAEEWDLANPLFTGCIRVYQADVKLRIVIYGFKDPKRQVVNDEDIVFFGECPIEIKPNDSVTLYVDGVIDSSRYYVLRIKDPKSTRTTNIGIGFREKEQGFDFKNCLNEYIRYVDRSQLADKLSKLSTSANHHDNNGGLLGDQEEFEDFIIHDQKKAEIPNHLADHISPLKEGEKIKVKLNIKSRKHDEAEEGESSHSNHSTDLLKPLSSKGGLNLKPPPPPGATVSTSTSSSSTNDDEWGDFSSGV